MFRENQSYEERNQESRTEEESPRQEKEVARAYPEQG
jgi:hypothetical protein